MEFKAANLRSWLFAAPPVDAVAPGMLPRVQDAPLRAMIGLGLYVAAYYVAYRFGMSFSQVAASPFWFPDSILLCALLVTRPRLWWVFILLTLPVRLLSEVSAGIPLWFLLATFAIDAGKALLAALALRRFIGEPFRLDTVRQVGAFFLFAVLLAPAIAACFGAAARGVLGHAYWLSWEQWFLGNALTQIVVTPVILYWALGLSRRGKPLKPKRWLEAGLLSVGLLAAGYAATNTGPSSIDFAGARFYAPVPFMFWAAIRFGMFGASGAAGAIAILAVHGALSGRGPFADLSPTDITLALQNFLLLRAAPLYLVAVVIEQRRQTEARLRESEDRFRNMANTAPVLLWIAGRDKACEFVNKGWLDLTGRSLGEVLGDGWLADLHPDDLRHAAEVYHAAFEARLPFEVEYRLRRRDGDYRWIMHKAKLRHAANGDFLGYIGSALDITDRKQVEEGARQLSHAQRLVVMGELSATIAHEVKQPLTAILANAEAARLLLSSADPPLNEIREIVADIRADDLRANDVISRIRAFLNAQARSAEALDINMAVSDALRLVAGDARRRRIQLRTDLAPGLPPVPADRTHLQQVLVNLIVNGMDAMQDISGLARDLTVRTALWGETGVEIAVADRGSGIAPDQMRRLFNAFFTTKHDGMGLGLSIARSIVTAHRGRIWADNNLEGGATFHIVLPIRQDQPLREGPAQTEPDQRQFAE